MLSDGSGAAFLAQKPAGERHSLRIDWIEHTSFAGELETCMYYGATKQSDGSMKYWREYDSLHDAVSDGAFFFKQDIKLLSREIINVGVRRALSTVIEKHGLSASQVDWFLPHLSSEFFRVTFYDSLKEIGFEIPREKWFTNLSYKGNTGSASIYIIIEELYHSNILKTDQKILCVIPESGRFSMCYMMLSVV
jgi:3-oxoacyl-[acyl-carrier-protein] synthase-3